MPFYQEYTNHYELTIAKEKQEEMLSKTRKGAAHDAMVLRKKDRDEAKEKGAIQTYVSNVTIDPDGTIKHYYNDEKYPVTGYADVPSVYVVAMYKRLIPLALKNIRNMSWWKGIITALGFLFSTKILAEWFELIFEMHKVLLKEEHYTPCVKEIRRVLRKQGIDERLIDGFTMILEYDTAYRYPVQDVLPFLDKEAFKNNWRKEFTRVFNILVERASPEDAQKFKNIARIVGIYLVFNRKLLKGIKQFVEEIDLTKIAPSDNDYYWMCYLATYNCFGMSVQEREEIRIKLNNGTLVGVA